MADMEAPQMSSQSDFLNGYATGVRHGVDLETSRSLKVEPISDQSIGTCGSLHFNSNRSEADEIASVVSEPSLDDHLCPKRGSDTNMSLSIAKKLPAANSKDTTLDTSICSSGETSAVYVKGCGPSQEVLLGSTGENIMSRTCRKDYVDPATIDLFYSTARASKHHESTLSPTYVAFPAKESNPQEQASALNMAVRQKGGKQQSKFSCSRVLFNEKSVAGSLSNELDTAIEEVYQTAYLSSSTDIVNLVGNAIDAIKTEKRKEKLVHNDISANMKLVSSKICTLRSVAIDLFNRNNAIDTVKQSGLEYALFGDKVDEGEGVCKYQSRLIKVKNYVSYIYNTSRDTVPQELQIPREDIHELQITERASVEDDEKVDERQKSDYVPGIPGRIMNIEDITISSGSGGDCIANANYDKQLWFREACNIARNKLKRVLQRYGIVSALCTVANNHIAKMEVSYQIALSCTTSVVNFLGPALEARRLVMLLVDSPNAFRVGSLSNVTPDDVTKISMLIQGALDAADYIIKCHCKVKKALEKGKSIIWDMQRAESNGGSTVCYAIAAVENVEKAAHPKANVNVDQMRVKLSRLDTTARPALIAMLDAQQLLEKLSSSTITVEIAACGAVDSLNAASLRSIEAVEISLETLNRASALGVQ